MNERKAIGWRSAGVFGAVGLAGLFACGGGAKPADAPGNCPDGTMLKGSDCVPQETSTAPASEPPPSAAAADSPTNGAGANGSAAAPGGTPGDSATGSSGKPPYDKDSVEVELKRAARQVKANCGSATDDSGAAPGPWGKTTASITLGRNGHVKDVSIPAPYDGQPGGLCAANAFKKIQFPPYASSTDVVVQWDIELVKPKH